MRDSVGEVQNSNGKEVQRSRLIDLLAQRWRVTVTLLVAPAGWGKSVALRQAITDNATDPTGTDLFVRCPPSPGRFKHALAAAIAPGVGAPGQDLDDALAGLEGNLTCVVIDDIHRLGHDEARLVASHIESAPSTVRFVLSGRSVPPELHELTLPLEVALISEDDLRFTRSELTQFALAHAVDASTLEAFAGWPALCRLGIGNPSRRTIASLLADAVATLDDDARRAFGACVLAGQVDADLLDPPHAAAATITKLPLVEAEAGGVHDIWRDHVEIVLSSDEQAHVASIVCNWHLKRGRAIESALLAIEQNLRGPAERAIRDLSYRGERFVSATEARNLADRYRLSSFREERHAMLLDGLVARMAADGSDATPIYEDAVQAFRAARDLSGEGAALVQLAGRRWRNSEPLDSLAPLVSRIQELSLEGVNELQPFVDLAEVAFLDLLGEFESAYQRARSLDLDELPPDWSRQLASYIVTLAGLAGRASATMPVAEQLLERFPSGPLELNLIRLAFEAGRPAPALAALENQQDAMGLTVSNWDRLEALSFRAVLGAAFGHSLTVDVDEASLVGPRASGYLTIGRLAVLVAAGEEAQAQTRLASYLDSTGIDNKLALGELGRFPAYGYVLSEPLRAVLDTTDIGSDHLRQVQVARCLLALRAGATAIPYLPGCDAIACALPLIWSVELAVRLDAIDPATAELLLQTLIERAGSRVAKTAGAVVEMQPELAEAWDGFQRRLPMPPGRVVSISTGPTMIVDSVAGPMTLVGKKAMLVGMLVLRRRCVRSFLADALWPHMDERTARTNLRVTLSAVRSHIDPYGPANAPGYNLRVLEDSVELHESRHLQVDLWIAQRALTAGTRAHERGDAAQAIECYETGLASWPERLLPELDTSELVGEVERVEAEFAAATVRLAQLYLASDRHLDVRRVCGDLLARDRLHEDVLRLLMFSAIGSDDHVAARTAADLYSEFEADFRPSAELKRLLGEIEALVG